jgi:MFS family permease
MLSFFRKYPDFAKLWFGRMISSIGDMVLLVWSLSIIYGETESTIMGSLVFLAGMIPDAIVKPISGTIMDTRDPRKFLIWGSVFQALSLLPMLAVSVWASSWLVWVILAFNFVESIFNSFVMSASSVLIHSIVDKEDMPKMASISSTGSSICSIIGLALGGTLVALLGSKWVITLDFISFIFVVIFVLFVGSCKVSNPEQKASFKFFKEGMSYLWHKPALRFILILAFIYNIGLAPVMVLMPAQVTQYADGNNQSFYMSIHYVAFDVGMLLMGLFLSHKSFHNRRLMLTYSLVGCTLAFVFMGLFQVLWISLACMFVAGVSLVSGQIPISSIMMQETEHELVGRVNSAFATIASVGMPATMFLSGVLGDIISISATYYLLAIVLFFNAVRTYVRGHVVEASVVDLKEESV